MRREDGEISGADDTVAIVVITNLTNEIVGGYAEVPVNIKEVSLNGDTWCRIDKENRSTDSAVQKTGIDSEEMLTGRRIAGIGTNARPQRFFVGTGMSRAIGEIKPGAKGVTDRSTATIFKSGYPDNVRFGTDGEARAESGAVAKGRSGRTGYDGGRSPG